MQIKIINSSAEYNKRKSSNSFLQSYEYGLLHKSLGNEPYYLGIYNGDELLISILLIHFKAKRGSYLFCPYGAFDETNIGLILDWCKSAAAPKVDFLRVSPLMDNSEQNKLLFEKNKFRKSPVHMMHPEYIWLLDISKSDDEILAQMRKNTRYYVNRAKKDGVTVVGGNTQELLDEFYEIHEETAKRQGFTPYSRSFLYAQLEQFAPIDAIKVFIGYHEGKAISGAVIMYYEGEASYHHGASLSEYSKIPASYLIQWEAILEAKKRGIASYNFWGVVENNPKHPWAGLSFFKQGFGGFGKEILHCMDLPLTPKYCLTWVIETLRRIKRGY